MAHLRRTRGMRRSRHHTQKTSIHGQITDAVSISERPPAVEDRALPGHWEGDLLFGSKNSQIATLVERQSRYVMLAKVGKKDTETVVNALIKHAQKLPHELYRSLTWDRGKEMADHRRFTLATDIKVYFCDPRSPWQRGSNENANGLLRQYLPKGLDLSAYSQSKLNAIARRLNERPRKTLHYETPAQRFHAVNQSKNLVHEVIVARDDGANELPMDDKHTRVNERRVQRLGEIADLAPGKSGKLTLNLKPGTYVLFCNQPGHYHDGMSAKLTVVP